MFIVNTSFTRGNFPDKLARITPIFKTDSRFDKAKTISVLFNFNKIIEKAMYHPLYIYLEHLKILYPLLFGLIEKNLQPCTLLSQSLNQLASP